jgi:4,5-dihydroxyphthalate decarboxylase
MHATDPAIGDLVYKACPLSDLYRMILAHGDFDASEFSLSNHIMYRDRGDHWLSAVPVFPSRVFRHSSMFVRKDSEIRDFRQLIGKRVGISEYTMTAAVWLRGIMLDDYGVHWRDIKWISRMDKRFAPPQSVDITSSPDDLEDLLLAGSIDALLTPRPRDLNRPPSQRRFRPLLDDVRSAERAYYERTGIFPIMHTVVVHHDALAKWPQAPKAIFDLYAAGKARALKRRLGASFLPWSDGVWDETVGLFGGDPLPYGLSESNRRTIETLCRYLHEQQLIEQPVREIDTLFAPGSATGSRA